MLNILSIFDAFYKKGKSKRKVSSEVGIDVKSKLVTLIILDGFGVHPDPLGNAVLEAKTPFLDRAWTLGKSTLIHASGTHVGLPVDEPGNSEVGHLSIGTGQVIYQSLPRINDSIANGEFSEIDEIKKMFEEVEKRKSNLHIMGILSAAGVHGHIDHLYAILEAARKNKIDPFLHIFTDGRDTPQTDGYFYISKLVQKIKELGVGKIASVSGRLYGMDRDTRWERTKKAYEAMVGIGERKSKDVFSLLQDAYKQSENDEVLVPTTMVKEDGEPVGVISENDVVIFFNFREDRARQMTKVFVDTKFDKFERVNFPKNVYFVTMTGYSEDLNTHVVFPPKKVTSTLASIISDAGLSQLHIAETEKFMHITYFLNGGVEKPHKGEEFFNIPSPRVLDYSIVPEMSAYIVRDEVLYRLNHLNEKPFSFLIINFANPDMVGHTGSIEATVKACEISDECTRDISKKTLEKGGVVIIIADHGKAETLINRVTKSVDVAHTNNPVPFILLNDINQVDEGVDIKLRKVGTGPGVSSSGILSDVAPTILHILDLPKGEEMTGVDLLEVI